MGNNPDKQKSDVGKTVEGGKKGLKGLFDKKTEPSKVPEPSKIVDSISKGLSETSSDSKDSLSKLKGEFDNLEADIIKEIRAKDSSKNLDDVAGQVEKAISADQVLGVLIQRFGSGDGQSDQLDAKFKAQFADIQKQYQKSFAAIKKDLDDYHKAVSDRKTESAYAKLFQNINAQGNLKTGVLSTAEAVGGTVLRKELEGMFSEALKNGDGAVGNKEEYDNFRQGEGIKKVTDRMEEYADIDNDVIKNNFEKLVGRLNAFEEIILKHEVEKTGVANKPGVERQLQADNILLALQNVMEEAAAKDPNIYKKMAPFLSDVAAFVDKAAQDISGMTDGGKKKERIMKLDAQIKELFGYLQGLKIKELGKVHFASTKDAIDAGLRLEEGGPEKDFAAKLDAMKGDPNNACVRYFLENHQLLDLEAYKAHRDFPRNQNIRAVEITLAYRKLYELFKDNQQYAEKYFGGAAQYRQFYDVLDNSFSDKKEEVSDMVYPYFMCVLNGEIYISTTAYNLEGEGQKEANFERLKSKNDGGVLEYDKDSSMVYYVVEDEGAIQKHPVIPVRGVAEAREMIAKYGKNEKGFLKQVTATLKEISGVFGAASGVVTNVDQFADALAKVVAKSPLERLRSADKGGRVDEKIEEKIELINDMKELKKQKIAAEGELAEVDEGSSKAKEIQKRIDDLDRKIKDKQEEIDAAGAVIDQLSALGGGGGGGGYGGGGYEGGGSKNGGDFEGGHGGGHGGDFEGKTSDKGKLDDVDLDKAFLDALNEMTPEGQEMAKEIMEKLDGDDLKKFKQAMAGVLSSEEVEKFVKYLHDTKGIDLD